MINTSRLRKKFILRPNIPDGTQNIEYQIIIDDNILFVGKSRYFGDYEIDYSSFIENYINKQKGFVRPDLDIVIKVICDGQETIYTEYYNSEILDVKTPKQIGIISGGHSGCDFLNVNNYSTNVSIFPIYYFTITGEYEDGTPFEDKKAILEPYSDYNTRESEGDFKMNTSIYFADESERADFINNVIKIYDYDNMDQFYQTPMLCYKDRNGLHTINLDNYIGSYRPAITPLYTKEYDSFEAAQADFMDYKKSFDFSESDLLQHFGNREVVWMQGIEGQTIGNIRNMQWELSGYGYKIVMMYLKDPNDSDNAYYTSEYVSCYAPDVCYTANIVLTNSGYFVTGETGAPKNVVIPIKIDNGMIKGRTVTDIEKITYIDRYGDTRNSIANDHIKLECYVDDEWLKCRTGDDVNYVKIFSAMQQAGKTYLCTNARISGMDGDEFTVIEGRISDVEKITTYSSYSSNKQMTYKILFEIYR